MVTAVNEINGNNTPAPPESIRRLFQSGAFSQKHVEDFFKWLDDLIRTGTTKEEREKNVLELLNTFFLPEKAKEIAAQLRLNTYLETQGKKCAKQELIDYIKLDKPIVFFDLETAGVIGKARYKIVEISVIKFHPDGKIEPWTARINPEMPIQKKAEEIHGINDIAVKDCPMFKHFAPTILEFFKDSHLGGFNAGFDINAIQKEFRDIGENFSVKGKAIIDPMAIYHKKVPYVEGETRKLKDAVRFYCGKELDNAHQAKADITGTVEVLKGQFEMYKDLPSDVYELSKCCGEKYYDLSDFVDEEGKFVFDEQGEVIFNFGKKHSGKKLKDVVEQDKGYLYWMLKEKEKKEDDFSFEIKQIIKNAIEQGVYPIKKEEVKV